MGVAVTHNYTSAASVPGIRSKMMTDITTPQLMFGLGPEADGALNAPLAREAPVKMFTSWYNSPDDLSWMSSWHDNLVPRVYAAGKALHLVVWDSSSSNTTIDTKYGPACGRPYALSAGFLSDMERLAQIYAGSGPLYVSLFAEFQTYPCVNNQWAGAENYYRALMDQYTAAKAIFHQNAPNSRVSLCWGGWQARFNNQVTGAGLALFPHFADVMQQSDFQSFQAMQSDSNASDVEAMTTELHQWGPVMLAYYKPDNGSQTIFDADTQTMLTDSYLARVTADGLFAWSFMDNNNLAASASSYQFVRDAIMRYAAPWIVPPITGESPAPTLPPTNTPIAPTNTPIAPTNTPIAPTNTPIAPTNTPIAPTVQPTNTPWPVTNAPTPPPLFSTGFEGGDPQPTWTNTIDGAGYPAGGITSVAGICCGLGGPETGVRAEVDHTGSAALMYSGKDTNPGMSYAYTKVFDLSGQNIIVGPNTTLSYWIYPQSSRTAPVPVSEGNSTCVAVDLIFTDGNNLRDSGAVDQNGNRLHPAAQCGHLTPDTWNHVTSVIGTRVAGKTIGRLDVGYDQPTNQGGYRGYIDDISIHN